MVFRYVNNEHITGDHEVTAVTRRENGTVYFYGAGIALGYLGEGGNTTGESDKRGVRERSTGREWERLRSRTG